MKRFPLLPLVALVFAAVSACTDSTAPANAPTLLARNASIVLGDPPPPPVDAAINVTIDPIASSVVTSSVFTSGVVADIGGASGAFNGTYFSKGTSWLRFDNKQPDNFGTTTSANARVHSTADKFFGNGTLEFDHVAFMIVEVTDFNANPSCNVAGEFCAQIEFIAVDKNGGRHNGHMEAFDREFCSFDGIFFCGGE
jgi:hypothetical protein